MEHCSVDVLIGFLNSPRGNHSLAIRDYLLPSFGLRELARRSKAAAKVTAEKTKVSETERRTKESRVWSTLICSWVQEVDISWAHQENIIEEARHELMEAYLSGTLPNFSVTKGVALEEIIDRSRPDEPGWDNVPAVAFYARWLARWTILAIPDATVRDSAVSDAFNRTRLREPVGARKRS